MASDRDRGDDGLIDYNITSGTINPHTYHLIVTASDSGNPQMSAIASVIVNVIATVAVNCTEMTFGE